MEFKIDNIYACEPIATLVTMLLEKGFIIEESKVSDYHFNEFYFLLRIDGNGINIDGIDINNIEKYSPCKFYCKCH